MGILTIITYVAKIMNFSYRLGKQFTKYKFYDKNNLKVNIIM